MVDHAAKLRANVVSVRIGGKDQYIVLNERNEKAARLAIAMKNMDAMELDRFTRGAALITCWFASVNTQYNPVFGVMNLARDLQGAMLQLSTTPLAGKQAEVFRNIRRNTRAIYKELRRERKEEGAPTGQWAQLWEQLQLDCGTTGYRDLYADPKDRAKALQKAGGVALGMASAMAGYLMMGGGDGADDECKKIPEFVKERAIIIPLGRQDYVAIPLGRQDYVAIPLPLGFHVFPNIGRTIVEMAVHDDPTKSRMGHVLDMAVLALDAYNPLGGSADLGQMASPTWFDPALPSQQGLDRPGDLPRGPEFKRPDARREPGEGFDRESLTAGWPPLPMPRRAATNGDPVLSAQRLRPSSIWWSRSLAAWAAR
ncbi:hypothetical protein KDK82_2140 [Delftia sp. K82]|nr:hypothetical protein KDK82_2140 [Delftia sp. K82]